MSRSDRRATGYIICSTTTPEVYCTSARNHTQYDRIRILGAEKSTARCTASGNQQASGHREIKKAALCVPSPPPSTMHCAVSVGRPYHTRYTSLGLFEPKRSTRHLSLTHTPVPGGLTPNIPFAVAFTMSSASNGARLMGMGNPGPFPSVICFQIVGLGCLSRVLHWKSRS